MLWFFSGVSSSLVTMLIIIPPAIIPFVILILLWELNIPQNISLMELLAYALIGGILSFSVNSLMLRLIQGSEAFLTAFREEPAKLIAALIIVIFSSEIQHKKIYGITGLIIGAAVGTGFSIFESITYAMNQSSIENIVNVQLMRAVLSPGGHIAYCAVYIAALLMSSPDGKIHFSSFISPGFFMSFIASSLAHAVWNGIGGGLVYLVVIVAIWALMLFWIRQCMLQVMAIGTATGGYCPSFYRQVNISPEKRSPEKRMRSWRQNEAVDVTVTCLNGSLSGKCWSGKGVISMGREENCTVTLPPQSLGVSRHHCSIQKTDRGWTVRDLDSTYGTYLSSGKLLPGRDYEIRDGERIYLGSKENAFSIRLM